MVMLHIHDLSWTFKSLLFYKKLSRNILKFLNSFLTSDKWILLKFDLRRTLAWKWTALSWAIDGIVEETPLLWGQGWTGPSRQVHRVWWERSAIEGILMYPLFWVLLQGGRSLIQHNLQWKLSGATKLGLGWFKNRKIVKPKIGGGLVQDKLYFSGAKGVERQLQALGPEGIEK